MKYHVASQRIPNRAAIMQQPRSRLRTGLILSVSLLILNVLFVSGMRAELDRVGDDLKDVNLKLKQMPFEKLTEQNVTWVTQHALPLFAAPPAIQVIRPEELARSWAASLLVRACRSLDLRPGGHPTRNWELSVAGQNLRDPQQPKSGSPAARQGISWTVNEEVSWQF